MKIKHYETDIEKLSKRADLHRRLKRGILAGWFLWGILALTYTLYLHEIGSNPRFLDQTSKYVGAKSHICKQNLVVINGAVKKYLVDRSVDGMDFEIRCSEHGTLTDFDNMRSLRGLKINFGIILLLYMVVALLALHFVEWRLSSKVQENIAK